MGHHSWPPELGHVPVHINKVSGVPLLVNNYRRTLCQQGQKLHWQHVRAVNDFADTVSVYCYANTIPQWLYSDGGINDKLLILLLKSWNFSLLSEVRSFDCWKLQVSSCNMTIANHAYNTVYKTWSHFCVLHGSSCKLISVYCTEVHVS